MRRILLLIIAFLQLVGCDLFNDGPEYEIEFDRNQPYDYMVPANGGEYVIYFTSARDWEAEVEYFNPQTGWISLTQTSGCGNYNLSEIGVIVRPNDLLTWRSAQVIIKSGDVAATVLINQETSFDDYPVEDDKNDKEPEKLIFDLTSSSAQIGCAGGLIQVAVKFNVPYTCTVEDSWIQEISMKSYDEELRFFQVMPNPYNYYRNSVITFCAEEQCIPFVVEQEPNPNYNPPLPEDPENPGLPDNPGTPDDPVGPDTPGSEEDWLTSAFYHHSLVMRFSADWCILCPNMKVLLDYAKKELPDRIEEINVHTITSALGNDVSEAIVKHYGISAYPVALVNGVTYIDNSGNIIDTIRETEENYLPVTGVSWTSSYVDGNVDLKIKAYFKEGGIYKITALLVEDSIISYQEGQDEGYVHSSVVRAALTEPLGDEMNVAGDGNVLDVWREIQLPYGCVPENVRVVVYIQKPDMFGNYRVDNVTSGKLGDTVPLRLVEKV